MGPYEMGIAKDPRPIHLVVTPGDEGHTWRVGLNGVTKITLYEEAGQMAMVLWLAVWKGESIAFRVCLGAILYVGYNE